MLKQGTMIDATLVAAQARPPAAAADGSAGRSDLDPDANWTRQGGPPHFGCKAHIAMDQGSRLICRARLTPAKVYESHVADELIIGDEKAVYADRAYEHKDGADGSRHSASRTASCITATSTRLGCPTGSGSAID